MFCGFGAQLENVWALNQGSVLKIMIQAEILFPIRFEKNPMLVPEVGVLSVSTDGLLRTLTKL